MKYSSYLIASLLAISFTACAEIRKPNKQEKWQEVSIEVESWVDGLGFRIDPKIKETVIALNALGISTTASCEGHLDHGCPYPWVDIDAHTSEIQILKRRLVEISEEIEKNEQLLKLNYPQLSIKEIFNQPEAESLNILFQVSNEISDKIRLAQQEHLKNLYFLIEKFYQKQDSVYDTMLFIQDNLNNARIQSVGGEWQRIRPNKEKEIKLNEYQKEMEKFSRFLREYFFQENCN